jgi:hypothetical protein
MKKSLTMISAALLLAGLSACGRGGDNAGDEARLNQAADMLDVNGSIDTSADDMTANASDVDMSEGNAGAPANAAAPGNVAVSAGNASTGNRQ